MLKSKEIADFVAAELGQLRPDEPVPSDLHLYFKSNSHVMLWQSAGTVFTREMLENYKSRGISQIWVYKTDWDAFAHYLGSPETPAAKLAEGTSAWEGPKMAPPPPPSELIYNTKVSAKDIEAILLDPSKGEREQRALAAKSSRTLLGELAAPDNLEEQDAIRLAVSKVVRELLDSESAGAVSQNPKEACRQIWKIAAKDPEHCHGVNVSTTAVLFALAFGRIESDLLADIALAGLVHDVGMTALPYQMSQIPREAFYAGNAEQMEQYLSHAGATPRLLSALAPEVPERAALLAEHHHDRYSAETASPLSDLAQLIAMADLLDSICCGHWDGKERTFAEGLARLEELESSAQSSDHQRFFNPDILAAVLRWIRSSIPEDALAAATEVVGRQMRSVQG